MIVFYHQTKTLISFWCRQGLNPRSFIQSLETLPVELIGTHNTNKVGIDMCFYKYLSTHSSYSKLKSWLGGLRKITRINVVMVLHDGNILFFFFFGNILFRRIKPQTCWLTIDANRLHSLKFLKTLVIRILI